MVIALWIAAMAVGPHTRLAEARGAARAAPSGGEAYWVQVGAYRDPETAMRVARQLREQKYRVQESVTPRQALAPEAAEASAPTGADHHRYEVVVAGGSGREVEALLATKGITSRAAAEGAVITPSLPLGEAVALSKDLGSDGLPARVRRVEAASAAAPRARGGVKSESLHRVRVGGFTDRATAEVAMKDLRARGYAPVLTRGSE